MERKFKIAADFIESSAEPATPHQGSAVEACQLPYNETNISNIDDKDSIHQFGQREYETLQFQKAPPLPKRDCQE
jgi:hypothetical protein